MLRSKYIEQIHASFHIAKVTAILGPRQCGKTTLARQYFTEQLGNPTAYFDLENPLDLIRLTDPMLALEPLRGLIVIDEIQRAPDLFPILRVLVDQFDVNRHFLILGSASRELIRQSSESLAGRIHYIELPPFSLDEIDHLQTLWLRGGFPLSYLASSDGMSNQWRVNYIRTFLEQDIPNLGIEIAPEQLRRFWMMIAHYHGQLFNASELGNSMAISHHTVKRYLDILTGTFMIRRLMPWYENISKRQVKTPKIYFRDSGIYHTLMNIPEKNALLTTPKIGASWEGFALESVIRYHGYDANDCYFWASHNQAELDLLVVQGMQRSGFEFKYTDAPRLTPSMKIVMNDLKLDKLTVIYPGKLPYRLTENIECIGLENYCQRGALHVNA